MPKYESKNRQVIDKAFSKFMEDVYITSLNGLKKMCEGAITSILSAHIDTDKHTKARDAYAYGIYYNGEFVSGKGFNPGNGYKENASDIAFNYVAVSAGWDAVIVAGTSLNFYRLDRERNYMTAAQQDIEHDFLSYFKFIQVRK